MIIMINISAKEEKTKDEKENFKYVSLWNYVCVVIDWLWGN